MGGPESREQRFICRRSQEPIGLSIQRWNKPPHEAPELAANDMVPLGQRIPPKKLGGIGCVTLLPRHEVMWTHSGGTTVGLLGKQVSALRTLPCSAFDGTTC
jgi:hypothetical protein